MERIRAPINVPCKLYHAEGRWTTINNFEGWFANEKALGVSATALNAAKINNADNGTAAAACIAPDRSLSHYIVPREKAAPAMRPFVKILWPLVYILIKRHVHLPS